MSGQVILSSQSSVLGLLEVNKLKIVQYITDKQVERVQNGSTVKRFLFFYLNAFPGLH